MRSFEMNLKEMDRSRNSLIPLKEVNRHKIAQKAVSTILLLRLELVTFHNYSKNYEQWYYIADTTTFKA